MKKLIISLTAVLFTVLSLVSCGGKDVEIVIPSGMASLMDLSDYSISDEKGYKSMTKNDDGSVTYVLSASQHKELMKEVDKKAEEFYGDILDSEEYPNITDVKTNSDYSEITITTKSTELDFQENLLNIAIFMHSGIYSMFEGNPDKDIKVEFINADSGDVIYSKSSKADEADKTETTTITTTTTTTATTTTTTATTTIATTQKNNSAANRTEYDGYNESENQKVQYKNLSLQIPKYYSEDKTDDDSIQYVVKNGSSNVVILNISASDFDLELTDDFLNAFSSGIKKNIEEEGNFIGEVRSEVVKENGNTYCIWATHIKNEDNTLLDYVLAYLFDVENKTSYRFIFYQLSDYKYSYVNDLLKILSDAQISAPAKAETPVQAQSQTSVKITGTRTGKDLSGNDILIVDYEFYNGTNENQMFVTYFDDKAYQNGVECDDVVFSSDYDADNLLKEVQPGYSITVSKAYVLTDFSTVTISVKKLFSGEEYVSQTVTF